MGKLATLLFACATLAVSSAYSSLPAMGPAPTPAADQARMAPQTIGAIPALPLGAQITPPTTIPVAPNARYTIPAPPPDQAQPTALACATAQRHFNNNLYTLFAERQGNVFYSGYSLHTALLMATHGARGATRRELQQAVLGTWDLADVKLQGAFRDLSGEVAAPGFTYTFTEVNRMWVDPTIKVLPAYTADVDVMWGAGTQGVDFKQGKATAAIINTWVENNTANKITKLVSEQDFEGVKMILTNAVYFKGKWEYPFKAGSTRPQDFTAPDGVIKIPMMYLKAEDLRYGEIVTAGTTPATSAPADRATPDVAGTPGILAGTKIIELDYTDDKITMRIALPPKGVKLEALSAQQLDLITTQALSENPVAVSLPKFKVEDSLDLTTQLEALGIKLAFGPHADFSGINGNTDLYISKVLQKASVEVNEEGTEAAAATAVSMSTKSSSPAEPKLKFFRADRPYLLQIIHRPTGAVLFTGRIVKPGV